MIDNSKVSNIPCRLHNVGEGGVAGADEVIDDNKGKSQQQINEEVDQILGAGGSVDERIVAAVNVEKTRAEEAESNLDGRVDTLEEAVGTGGSVDSRIASAVAPKANSADVYAKTETYNKDELNNMITTPNQEFVSVVATDQTTAVTDVLPATGEADTIYRVGNWDGTQYNDSVFSEYAWNGSAYVKLSTKSQVGEVYDISANHAGATYVDLSTALGTNGANIPQSLRKGGMSVKYVQSSDNKYVQYRLMNTNFSSNEVDWELDVFEIEKWLSGAKAIFSIKNKSIGKTSGNLNNANGYNSSELIPVDNISVIELKAEEGTYITTLAFYNSNKEFLSSASWGTGISTHRVAKSDFPANTAFIRVSDGGYANAYAIGLLSINSLWVYLNNLRTDISDTIKELQLNVWGDSSALYNKSGAMLKNGTVISADGYHITDFLSVKGISKLLWIGSNGGNTVNLCFYDSNKNFLGYYGSLNTNYYSWTEVDLSDAPNGTVYVRAGDNSEQNHCGIVGISGINNLIVELQRYKGENIFELIDGDYSSLYQYKGAMQNSGNVIIADGYYITDYLPLSGIDSFWWRGANGGSSVNLSFYDSDKNFLGYYGLASTNYYNWVEITSSDYPVGSAYIRVGNNGETNKQHYGILGIPRLADAYSLARKAMDSIPTPISPNVTSINKLYAVAPSTTYGRDYAINMYLEGLIRDKLDVSFAGGTRSKFIQSKGSLPESGGVISTNHTIKIGNTSKTVTLVRASNTRGQNKLMKVLAIGDSTLDKDLADAKGVKSGGWNYMSCVKELLEKDNIDISNISATMVGTRNNKSGRTISYGGQTITIRAFSEGRAGWTCYGYLNFPCAVKMGVAYENTPRLNSPAAWYALGLATRTPFDSSTAGQTWESYTDTDAQKLLIATTPFGRYKTDVGSSSEQYTECADLWIRVNYLNGNYSPETYTGTAEQKAYIENYISNIMDNPANPFYSKAKAQAYTGSHVWTYDNAFSLTEYLSRYRTMDDLGVRLSGTAGESVTGSDGETYVIGSKVSNVNDYDVCMPNYVFIGTGTNDVDSSVAIAKETIESLINCVYNEDSDIKVAWGIPRTPFVFDNCYPNLNAREATSGGNNYDINEEMFALLTDTTQDSRKFFLPIYNTMSVVGGNGCVSSLELDTDNEVISAGSDYVHPSLYQSRTIAYQIYAWLYYMN